METSESGIRNIACVAHVDAGKTTFTEALLFRAGEVRRAGSIEEGTTETDYLEEERRRGITIQSALTTFSHDNTRYHVIDTPGHIDFFSQVLTSFWGSDATILLVDGRSGVQAQTERVLEEALAHDLSPGVFLNKMDLWEDPDWAAEKSLEDFYLEVSDSLPRPAALVVLPFFDPVTGELVGAIDLIEEVLLVESDEPGQAGSAYAIPAENADQVERARYNLRTTLEACFLEQPDLVRELGEDKFFRLAEDKNVLRAALALLTRRALFIPVWAGSARLQVGPEICLNHWRWIFPGPERKNRELIQKKAAKSFNSFDHIGQGLNCGLSFKVWRPPETKAGTVNLVRVLAGTLEKGMALRMAGNTREDSLTVETVGRVSGARFTPLLEGKARPGDLVGLRLTGGPVAAGSFLVPEQAADPVGAPENEIIWGGKLESDFVPVVTVSLESVSGSRSEQEALVRVLREITMQDPFLRMDLEKSSGQMILSGIGELQLEVVVRSLRRDYHLDVRAGRPLVIRRETLTRGSIAEAKYPSREDDAGFVLTGIRLEAVSGEEGSLLSSAKSMVEFEIADGVFPAREQSPGEASKADALKAGALEALEAGTLGFSEVRAARVVLERLEEIGDGEKPRGWFKAAAGMAVRAALASSTVEVEEPWLRLEIGLPGRFTGKINGELSRRNCRIIAVEEDNREARIKARGPVESLIGFSDSLRSIAAGKCWLVTSFDGYRFSRNKV